MKANGLLVQLAWKKSLFVVLNIFIKWNLIYFYRPAGDWSMLHPNKLRFTQMFNMHDRNKRGFLTGEGLCVVRVVSTVEYSGIKDQKLRQIVLTVFLKGEYLKLTLIIETMFSYLQLVDFKMFTLFSTPIHIEFSSDPMETFSYLLSNCCQRDFPLLFRCWGKSYIDAIWTTPTHLGSDLVSLCWDVPEYWILHADSKNYGGFFKQNIIASLRI